MAALSNIALIAAADRGHLGVVQALLEAGYPPEVQDPTGESALSVAANKGHAAVVSALLAAGASPHHRSLDGETPLHAAALSGSAECVRLLLEAGSDPDVQSDLLLSYDEMTRISSRNFRNPSELGEWFRRQPRTSRLLMMESASIMGGCTPVSLAVGVGRHDSAVMLLDALGCTGKAPLSKAKVDLLQGLLGIASSTGSMAMATMLLDRLQACGAASCMALTDAPSLAPGRRAVASAGSRSGKASRTATAFRTGRRGGGGGDGDAVSWDGNAPAGVEMVDAQIELIAAEGLRLASSLSAYPPWADEQPGSRDPGAGVGGAVDGGKSITAIEMERAARKASVRAGRALQVAEAAAQQAQLRLERRRQQQQEQRQQQLLAKKQMQKELQRNQQPAEARVAENAGVELQKYILQERQQLRKKLGLDQDTVGGANGTKAAAARPTASEANSGAAAATGAPEFQCTCRLRDDVLDQRVASAAASSGSSAAAGVLQGGSAAGVVRCQVDPEHGAVGLRQRRLVVCCSGGCQLDYHYPDCWRAHEALMKAARPDYHGLKGPAGRSHAAGIPCWSPDCTGVVLSAAVMEGTAENPRFHKALYAAPCTVQQQQQQHTCKGGKVPAAATLPSATTAPADETAQGRVRGLSRKADRQKHWQQQSWYPEYEEYGDEKVGGDESQEGGPEQGEHGVEQEEEKKVAEGRRAAELVDLSAVKLVPLNRRQALAGLELEVEAPGAANGSGAGGATATTLDDVEAAPLVESGAVPSRARNKRGGGVKLALADLHLNADAAEESAVNETWNVRPEMQPPPSPPPRHAGVNAWKDTSALPFAVRPVWERDASVADYPKDGKARAATSNGSEQASYIHTQAGWSSAHQAAVGVMVGAQPVAGGSTGAPRPQMTEEDFPSLIPVNPDDGEKAAGGAASDPIIRALQLLKVPSTDILTGHLLLEGSCLRHLYTVLFRGRSCIADAQLSAVLDRCGGMTAFQSFENGAAVAVSYRSEDTALAVAAGLGAGDALSLLGPSSLAGAGGLEVSCLLEFPTDYALAREMGQAERATGVFAGSGGRAEGKGLVDGRKLSAGAVPFVPGGCSVTRAKAVVAPPLPPPGSAATPITAGDGMGSKNGSGAAGSHSNPTVAAGAQPQGIAPRAAQVPLVTTHGTANTSASITTVSDMSSSMRNDNSDDVHSAISAADKSQALAGASGAGVRDFRDENTWTAPAENGASWDDAYALACPWSDGNLPPTAEIKNAGPAASRTVPAVLSLPAPTRVVSASVPMAVAPRPVLATVAAPTRIGPALAKPTQGLAVTGAPRPVNTATAAQAPVAAGQLVVAPVPALSAHVPTPPSLTASVTVPVVAAPVVPIPVAPVMTAASKAATSSQLAPATGPSVVPSPIRRVTLAGFQHNMLQRHPQPQLRYDAPSGIIAPASTPTRASSCLPETFTPCPSVTPQVPAQPALAGVMAPPPPPQVGTLNPRPILVRGQGQANASMHVPATAWPSALLLAKPWLAARPAMQTAPAPTVGPAMLAVVASQTAPPSSYPTALLGSYSVAAPVEQTAGASAQPGWNVSTALEGVQDDEGDADVLSDVLGLCLA
ncbi:hypothetical protein VaNZ11_013325 [Volvox africanus]|uniref:Uncharacterized protein n=1 Tax=Volvox africanus TaxID=51714 RepID=A0ABQ5SH96_9CHLO|nr:hypothetical protein VaNZ11_013325 [Volvox africanus]